MVHDCTLSWLWTQIPIALCIGGIEAEEEAPGYLVRHNLCGALNFSFFLRLFALRGVAKQDGSHLSYSHRPESIQ